MRSRVFYFLTYYTVRSYEVAGYSERKNFMGVTFRSLLPENSTGLSSRLRIISKHFVPRLYRLHDYRYTKKDL